MIALGKITRPGRKNPQGGKMMAVCNCLYGINHGERWSLFRLILFNLLHETLQFSSNDSEADRAKRPAIQRRESDCPRSVPSPGAPTTVRPAPDQFLHRAIEKTGRGLRPYVNRRLEGAEKPSVHL